MQGNGKETKIKQGRIRQSIRNGTTQRFAKSTLPVLNKSPENRGGARRECGVRMATARALSKLK
jgi:ribosomal protein S12